MSGSQGRAVYVLLQVHVKGIFILDKNTAKDFQYEQVWTNVGIKYTTELLTQTNEAHAD